MFEQAAERQRFIQEYVPGKQVTLAHLIANPEKDLFRQLGLDDQLSDAIGIMTITPGEAVIIAADVMLKSSEVTIGFLDRFGGSLVACGDVESIRTALRAVVDYLDQTMGFSTVGITVS